MREYQSRGAMNGRIPQNGAGNYNGAWKESKERGKVQAPLTKKSVKAKIQSVKHLSQRGISLSLSLSL